MPGPHHMAGCTAQPGAPCPGRQENPVSMNYHLISPSNCCTDTVPHLRHRPALLVAAEPGHHTAPACLAARAGSLLLPGKPALAHGLLGAGGASAHAGDLQRLPGNGGGVRAVCVLRAATRACVSARLQAARACALGQAALPGRQGGGAQPRGPRERRGARGLLRAGRLGGGRGVAVVLAGAAGRAARGARRAQQRGQRHPRLLARTCGPATTTAGLYDGAHV
mmetsp:Transcript_23568/g.60231  ORF Transcript_23568/g.60231 Transcript_23568/m.60231 type:complete len:223 (+) Transcript_23568:1054-1722(+)